MPAILTDRDWEEPQLARTQEKFLRAFAPVISWYRRPPSVASPVPDAFTAHVCVRMHQVLRPEEACDIALQDISMKRRAMRHLCYKILLESTRCFTDNRKPHEVVHEVRDELHRMIKDRRMLVRHPHHPLYVEKYKLIETNMGLAMEANAADVRLADWLHGFRIEKLIASLPEFTHPAPDVRLVEYVPKMRAALRSLIDSFLPEAEIRAQAFTIIVDEWLRMADAMNMQKKAAAAAASFGLSGILDEQSARILSSLSLPALVKSSEQEERIVPLMQQLLMRMADEKDRKNLSALTEQWVEILMQHKIAPCDRPALNLAMLAVMFTDEDYALTGIREKL